MDDGDGGMRLGQGEQKMVNINRKKLERELVRSVEGLGGSFLERILSSV